MPVEHTVVKEGRLGIVVSLHRAVSLLYFGWPVTDATVNLYCLLTELVLLQACGGLEFSLWFCIFEDFH